MKAKTAYVCSECGAVALQWFGSCPSCGAAGTLSEAASQPRGARSTAKAIPLEKWKSGKSRARRPASASSTARSVAALFRGR
jgi:DNA repair protein RadA/Sms